MTKTPIYGRLPGALAALLLVAGNLPEIAAAQTPDDMFCGMVTRAAQIINAQGPMAIDGVTTRVSTAVACNTKTVLTKFVSTEAASDQPPGWSDAWQKKLNTRYCDEPASREIIDSGWTLAESTKFADGVEFEIKAVCE